MSLEGSVKDSQMAWEPFNFVFLLAGVIDRLVISISQSFTSDLVLN
jgi:hypothetical protein